MLRSFWQHYLQMVALGALHELLHTDRRQVLIQLTDEGLRVHQALLPEILRAEMDWMGSLSPDEQETLIELLGKVQAHLYETR